MSGGVSDSRFVSSGSTEAGVASGDHTGFSHSECSVPLQAAELCPQNSGVSLRVPQSGWAVAQASGHGSLYTAPRFRLRA